MSFQFASPLDPTPSNPSRTRSTVRFRTDGTNLRITVASCGRRIPAMDRRRFTDASVWAGLLPFRERNDILPVFAFRIGGWHFRAPVILGGTPSIARDELQDVLLKARSKDYAGNWTLGFTLTDTAARKIVASRSGPVPPRLRGEIATALLGSCRLDTDRADRILALVSDNYPSDYELFEGLPYTPRIA
jgi:hypothetical protein